MFRTSDELGEGELEVVEPVVVSTRPGVVVDGTGTAWSVVTAELLVGRVGGLKVELELEGGLTVPWEMPQLASRPASTTATAACRSCVNRRTLRPTAPRSSRSLSGRRS